MNDAWWTISGEALLAALWRSHNGEHPEFVYMELYANTSDDDNEV